MCDFCDSSEVILTDYYLIKDSEPILDENGKVVAATFGKLGSKKYCLTCGEKLTDWRYDNMLGVASYMVKK